MDRKCRNLRTRCSIPFLIIDLNRVPNGEDRIDEVFVMIDDDVLEVMVMVVDVPNLYRTWLCFGVKFSLRNCVIIFPFRLILRVLFSNVPIHRLRQNVLECYTCVKIFFFCLNNIKVFYVSITVCPHPRRKNSIIITTSCTCFQIKNIQIF